MKKQYKIKNIESLEEYIARMAIVMDWSEDEVDIANEIANRAAEAARVYTFKAIAELTKSISIALDKGKNWKGEIKL